MMVVPGSLGRLGAIASVIAQQYGSFTPASLFTTGVNGVWYDPSDFTTLFQDAAGTAPVTAVEQPVGLMLDKSKGLSVSATDALAGNGNFDTPAYWSDANGVSTITGGQLVFNGSATLGGKYCTPSVVIGRYYEVSFDVVSISQGGIKVWVGLTQPVYTATTPGTHRYRVACTGDTLVRVYNYSTATTAVVDNVVVKEVFGNHAFNNSGNSANFPVLSARYNLLTKTEQFDDAAWATYTNLSVLANQTINPIGGSNGYSITTSSLGGTLVFITAVSAGTYTISLYAKGGTTSTINLDLDTSGNGRIATFTLTGSGSASAVSNKGTGGTVSGGTASIARVGSTDWYQCVISGLTLSGANYFVVSLNETSKTAYIWGASLTVANDALNQPAYQRVNTSSDYDTVGFKPYLRFNGTNQWLQTNSIDFTYGDKMFVSAGVRKLQESGSSAQFICELSADAGTSNGGLYLTGWNGYQSPNHRYAILSRGTASATSAETSASYAAPITNVISGIGNISGDQSILRVNGSQAAISTADQGTGNYGNYPLYMGARAGSTFWFNGRLYGMVVAGKQASADEVDKTEDYLALKTGFSYPSISGIPTFTAVV